MTTEIRPFEYDGQQVRTITDEQGDTWFVATDVARILGYGQAAFMTRRLDEDDKGLRSVQTPGGQQNLTIISEPGLYTAVLGSQVPGAREFKRWVTHDVLPTIRRTGAYQAPAAAEPTGKVLLARAVLEAQSVIETQQLELEQARPKVNYHDTFVATEDKIAFRTLANQLQIGEHRLRADLLERKWIYKETSTRWSNTAGRLETVNQYRAYAHHKAYFTLVPAHHAPRVNGKVQQTLYITPAGAEAIARHYAGGTVQTELEVN